MNVTVGAKTDTGQRANNEDLYAVVDTRKHQMRVDGALIIADGMGGRSFGEQASAATIETVEDILAEMLDSRREGEVVIADALALALRKANARVYALSHAEEDRRGMGTTCVAAVIDGETLYVAHAGDSRAYLLREGLLKQLTADHSYVAEQVRAGAISEEGARKSRFRNIITRAVGIEPAIEADVAEFEVRPGDVVLLCTDGLSNMVEENDIARTLTQVTNPQAAADRLVQMANKNGGKDNITAVVAHLKAGTRTLRMQVADMIRPGSRPEASPAPNTWSDDSSRPLVSPPIRRSPVAAIMLTGLLAVLSLGAAIWFGSLLIHNGYHFQSAPPFAVKAIPSAPPVPKLPDAAHVAYASPVVLYAMPVRGDLLAVSPKDGSVTVASLSGAVLSLSPDGKQVHYKYTLPAVHAKAPAPPGALGANGATVHMASDPQGNLYVSDALAKTVTKYQPNGIALGLVSHLSLTNPQSIAAAADGTIYLVDGERLKVLHAKPSTTPLPPIPAPALPKPAAMPLAVPTPIAPAVPAPTAYRHGYHGYRHYGYHHFRHYGARQF